LQIKNQAKHLPVVEMFVKDCPHVFVAGSSWPPDEEIFVKHFTDKICPETSSANGHHDWKLIIAPHVIGEDHLKQIFAMLRGKKVARYTEYSKPESDLSSLKYADVLIIDCFGLLSSIYHYATVTYVGGGFGVGIHNVLEAAVWNVPVIIGPNNERFQEAQELMADGGCFEINNYDEFDQLMDRLTTDADFLADAGNKAAAYVRKKAGATTKILSDVSL
jgi:3-deoxy-D-manno-octulosonic-acid transferase